MSDEVSRPAALAAFRKAAFLIVPAAFIGLLAFALFGSETPRAVPGHPAPEFELELIEGGTISSLHLKGRPVVINFWTSWCAPCREEARELERAWRTYEGRGVRFLGVNLYDFEEEARGFIDEFGLTFPVARDVPQGAARKFGVTGIPETYFIDSDWRYFAIGKEGEIGRKRGVVVRGAISPSVLRANIEAMLDKSPAPAGSPV